MECQVTTMSFPFIHDFNFSNAGYFASSMKSSKDFLVSYFKTLDGLLILCGRFHLLQAILPLSEMKPPVYSLTLKQKFPINLVNQVSVFRTNGLSIVNFLFHKSKVRFGDLAQNFYRPFQMEGRRRNSGCFPANWWEEKDLETGKQKSQKFLPISPLILEKHW